MLLLLGAPEVRHGGQLVTFPTRKALALLAYLAVEGRPQPREKLAALFWPESDAERSRTMLRRTLAYLREGLRAADQPADTAHLLVERDMLGFEPSDAETDLHAVEGGWSRARMSAASAAAGEGQRALIAQLQAAAGRYRGDFLDGFALSDAPEFDTWASIQRELWHRRMSLIFDRLAEAQFTGGALDEALETSIRWIAHAPLDESAHRRRMQIHYAGGDRAAALQAYEACRKLLADELSAEPALETEVLAERIRSDKLKIEHGELRKEHQDTTFPFSILNTSTALRTGSQFSIPLVGRLNQHTQLVTAFTAMRRGHPQAVILEGAAGMGKTRLAHEFLRWAAAHDAVPLHGQALATATHLPYQPWVELLRRYLPGMAELRGSLGDVWLAELSRLLPELHSLFADLPAPPVWNEATGGSHLFEAIARLVQAIASRRPVVLFVDDIQWADTASRDCMLYAGRRWAESGAHVLLIGALGQPDSEDHAGATGWLQHLGRALPLTRLRLDALAPDDMLKLFQSLVELHESDGDLPGVLLADADGRPGALLQMLQTLSEQGYARQDEHGRWTLSGAAALASSLRDSLRARASTLPSPAEQSTQSRRRRRPAGLPAPPTPLIGRAQEVAAIRQTFLNHTTRLVTLIGPPGIGKTRLAIQVAEETLDDFEDGVYFVALAAIQDARLVAGAIAQVLAIQEAGDQPVNVRLAEALRDRHMLLVLDNFEQVQPAAALLSELLAAAPWLHLLVTSRNVLHIYGEHGFAVLPLPVPPTTADKETRRQGDKEQGNLLVSHSPILPVSSVVDGQWSVVMQYAAVQLFVQRAQAANSDFNLTRANTEAVAEVCARLEGVPLALELAAARIKSLSAHALLARLNNQLALLTGGPRDLAPRQRALRSAISWSYSLLDSPEQVLFARLSVFVGGWTAETAEAVASELRIENEEWRSQSHEDMILNSQFSILNLLDGLVDKSLLWRETADDGAPRFTMLEAIREYAAELLAERRETELLRRRHATAMLALAERVEPDLAGPRQGELLEQLEREHNNMRAALNWSIVSDQVELGLQLCIALWWFWFVRGHLSEGRRWLEAMIAKSRAAQPAPPPLLYAKLLNAAGVLAHDQGDYSRATELHEEGLAIVRQLGYSQGIAAALNNLGLVARSQGEYARAAEYYTESLALRRAQGDEWSMAVALSNLGLVAQHQGEYALAVARLEESLALRRKLGDQRGIAILLNSLGVVSYYQGDYQRSAALHEQSLALQRQLADRAGMSDSLCGLGQAALRNGELLPARRYYREALALRREFGDPAGMAACLEGLAGVAHADGQLQYATRLIGAATALRNTIGAPHSPIDLPDYQRMVAAIRAQLGETDFARAWADGQMMSSEQIVIAELDAEV
jgi:predicted ATPase/DNA-binding SARP family transcriptional activator